MMVDSFIKKQKDKIDGFNVTECLKMFGLSDSGYYGWKKRQEEEENERNKQKQAEDDLIRKTMLEIIKERNGIIPGKRTFRIELFRHLGFSVSIGRVSRLMKEMNLVAQKPHKDAYKNQAVHDHLCASPGNKVGRDFYIGPRRVILTDITYLYYGPQRKVFYLCVFRDAFTKENLGWSSSDRMTTDLIEAAYKEMIQAHGHELKNGEEVYVHSDQGSQYLSTTFRTILKDEGFVQSVSDRGNSQDNAPMESFFGRLKADILDLVARCLSLEQASKLSDGYLRDYNSSYHQYELAGLSPAEFYQYAMTGIYPLPEYFGVKASDMMGLDKMMKVRTKYAEDRAEKRREAEKKKKEAASVNPLSIIMNDQKKLGGMIRKCEKKAETMLKRKAELEAILKKTEGALAYIKSLAKEKYEELKDPTKWVDVKELDYIFDMNGMF